MPHSVYIVYKSLHGLTPAYLVDDSQLVTEVGRRRLRSPDVYACAVPRTQSQTDERSGSWTVAMEQSADRDPTAKHKV